MTGPGAPERLADVAIDRDGDELVFRLRPGDRVRAALAWLLNFPSVGAAATITEPVLEPKHKSDAITSVRPDPRDKPDRARRDREIAHHYVGGATMRECRKKFGCNQRRVEAALERTATPVRPSGRRPRQTPAPEPKTPAKAQHDGRAKVAPIATPPDPKPNEKTDAGCNTRNEPIARGAQPGKAMRDAIIERLYAVDQLSPASVAEEMTRRGWPLTGNGVLKVLRGRRVQLRDRSEAQRIRKAQDAAQRDMKLPAAVVPSDAPRVRIKLSEARPIEPPVKRTQSEMLHQVKERSVRVVRQKKAAENAPPLTAKSMQDAVAEYFERGGKVTEIVTEKAPDTSGVPVGVGVRSGRGYLRGGG